MKELFEQKRFTGKIKVKLQGRPGYWQAQKAKVANDIIVVAENYENQGYRLSLRQLYYQLVAADAIPNDDAVYKKLGRIKDDLCYSGLLDWETIEDRGRVPHMVYTYDGIKDAVEDAIRTYQLPRQKGQEIHVELWTEKDAISNILKRVTTRYGIRLVVNKGYTSSSAIYKSYTRFVKLLNQKTPVTVLYFGDHDPSGLDMVRDIKDRIQTMMLQGERLDYSIAYDYCTDNDLRDDDDSFNYWVTKDWNNDGEEFHAFDNEACYVDKLFNVNQIGLTMDQIKEFNPPPNPAKITDPRAKGYIAKHGDVSWEVDALKPSQLIDIVETNIMNIIDFEKYKAVVELEDTHKLTLKEIAEDIE